MSCDRKFGLSYGAPGSGWPSSDSSWQSYYMLGTTTKLSIPFQVLKEIFFSVADPGGVRGEMHPPFEGLPSRVLSKCVQT